MNSSSFTTMLVARMRRVGVSLLPHAHRLLSTMPRPPAAAMATNTAQNTAQIVEIKSPQEFEQLAVVASAQPPPVGGPVILDFYADWCGPCKQLTPKLEKLVMASQGAVRLAKINVDNLPEIAQALQVKSLPTVMLLHAGKLVDQFTGVLPDAQIKQFVDKAAALVGGAGVGPRALEEAATLLEGGDVPGATLVQAQNAGPVALRQIRLERTDPARIGGLLRDEAARSDGLLRVVDDGASSTILLAGSPREVEAAAAMTALIDRQTQGARNEEVRLLPLRGLRAAETVELVGSVTALGGPKPWLVAEPVTNSIVLRGDAPELKPIVELLARLDDPMAKDLPPFEAIRVAHRTPGEVRTAVESALAGIDAPRRERVRLVADDALGFLFVRADETLVAEVRAAIAAADVPPPADVLPPAEAPAPPQPPAPPQQPEAAPAEPTR